MTAGRPPLELWAGPECTIVRVGDRWRDQFLETGHRDRDDDIARIASLGVRTVRYPLLWESIAPERSDCCDFGWSDKRIALLDAHGIEVIGGLLHHGSGPCYTNLLDPDFPAKFADFAARVGAHYPGIRRWTPINEPLTTARFSALYGHWYPHLRDYPSFLRALVNQCLGTQAAMQALRATNPDAELVQTEDLGKTFATPPALEQSRHENERRWLSWDLLCGRVDPDHPLFDDLVRAGISPRELERLHGGAAAPAMLGINHYLTSDRFLDHRIDLYPDLPAGGNGRIAYVDAEAVRVPGLETGLRHRVREAWDRYRLPIAVTEVHHGCTREEGLRWLAEVMDAAASARAEGIDLRAVTLWSLFGNVDWRSLVTREDGHYDPGAFDARAPAPRPTVIARAASAYARGERFRHPVLETPGWWRRDAYFYAWCAGGTHARQPAGTPLLITGATGTLGQAMARICAHRGLAHRLSDRRALEICDAGSIGAALDRTRPWAVINAAGYVRVDDAEREPEACMAANALGPELLARACAQRGIPLVTFSSDLVFDGTGARGAYVESDPPNPTSTYGRSKAEAERRLATIDAQTLVIRTSAFFGPWDRFNFAWDVLSALSQGRPFAASRHVVSPTFVPDLCHAALDLLIDGETGIWHLAGQGSLSWHDFALRIAEGAGLDPKLILADEDGPVRSTALSSERGWIMRPLDKALESYLQDIARAPAVRAA